MTNKEAYEYFRYRLNFQCGKATTQRAAFLCALEALKKVLKEEEK